MDNEFVDIRISDDDSTPILRNDVLRCRRCNKIFHIKKDSDPNKASYYRCENCLTLNSCLTDFIYSCLIQ